MLRLIPPPLHRAGLRLAHGARKRWWRIRRPRLSGCRVIALDNAGRVLLIRHTYGSDHWMLPGGGMGRREDPLAAAMRELAEETGCSLADARVVTVVDEPLWGASNTVHIVAGRAIGAPRPDRREVSALAFHAPDALPAELAPALAAGLAEWLVLARAAD